MHRPRHVVLIGLMGSGKSTVGVPLAERLGRRYVDNDDELRERTGRTARDLAAARGLDALHRAEAETFLAMLAGDEPAVLGAPASAIVDPDVRGVLPDHFVVWLDTDLDTLTERLQKKAHRPQLEGNPRDVVTRLHRERAPLYRDVASYIVHRHAGDHTAPIVDRIATAFAQSEPGDQQSRH